MALSHSTPSMVQYLSLLSIAKLLAKAIFAQVEEQFLHMLAEVDPLPDVKDLRFNIASFYEPFTRGPAKLKIGTSMPKLVQFTGFNI